jgi:hypothetical protein
MYRVIKFTGALGANNTVTIAPNTSPAWFIIENATTDSGSGGPYSVILTQGSGANVTVQNGKNAIIYCDGAGSGAVVYDALADLQVGTLEVTGAAAIDGALTAAAITATTLTTSGIASIDDTTDTTSGTTGSIHTDGGVGVAKALYVGTTAKIIGVTTHGGDVVSDTDGTDSLGTTAVRWLKGWFDSLTVTGDVGAATGTFSGEVTGAGFTGTLDGVLGGGTPAAATVTTLNGVTAPTAQYTSAEETKLAGIETAADVTDATNVLAGLVGQEAVATGFTGTLDGVLGGGTPAAVTATTGTFSGTVNVTAGNAAGLTVSNTGGDVGIKIVTDNVGYACVLELADGTTSWYVANSHAPSSSFGIGRNNQGTDLTIDSSGNVGIPAALSVIGEVTGAGFTGTLDGVLGGGTPAAATVTTLNGVTAPTAQYTSAEETKLAGIETAADVTDATNVLAGLVGQEVVATGFTGTLDGVLGGGTPAAVTATTVTASGVTTVNAYAQTGFIVNAAGHDAGIRIATDNVGYACGLELADGTTSWYVVNSWGPSSSFGIGRNNQGTDLTINSSGNVGIPGALAVTGAVSKGSGSFKIRHPLVSKKDTHNLVHSFIEGPQADLIYRGRATLTSGSATVNIDVSAGMTAGTFEALCRDVQCFTSNESGWTCVRGSVSGATLTIEAEANDCIDTISWMVVGERKDIHMYETEWTDENGRVIVEPEIPVEETTVFEKHSGV